MGTARIARRIQIPPRLLPRHAQNFLSQLDGVCDGLVKAARTRPARIEPGEEDVILYVHQAARQLSEKGVLVRKIAVERRRRHACALAHKVCCETLEPDLREQFAGGREDGLEGVLAPAPGGARLGVEGRPGLVAAVLVFGISAPLRPQRARPHRAGAQAATPAST